jgi:hypothetical protein
MSKIHNIHCRLAAVGFALILLICLNSCNAAGELLDVDTPVRLWTGQVVRPDSTAASGAVVVIRAEEPASETADGDEPKELLFTGSTDSAGNFSIPYLWHQDWTYSITVVHSPPDEGPVSAAATVPRVLQLSNQVDFITLLPQGSEA